MVSRIMVSVRAGFRGSGYCSSRFRNPGSWAIVILFVIAAGGTVLVRAVPVLAQESQNPRAEGVEREEKCSSRPISIAAMQWPSSRILALVHARILENELGCRVQVIPGEMASIISSMAAAGEPAMAPEVWIGRIAGIWNSVLESGRVRLQVSTFDSPVLEGWYLPPELKERLPGLNGIMDLEQYVGQMTDEGQRPRFISCPADWACSIINANLLRALGLENEFEMTIPKNRFEMDFLIAEAVSRRQPVVFYYWQPNAILAQFDFSALDMGEFDGDRFKCLAQADCPEPEPSSFAPEQVFMVATDWLEAEAPSVAGYMKRAVLPIDEMNLILSWQAEGEADFERLARRFIDERREVWEPWVEGLR